jgi:glycosyltransferase involved in cell wall biosynthesis
LNWTILQIIPELAAGGAERTTIEVAEAVCAKGGRALVASAGGRLESELQAVGGEHFLLPLKTKNPYQAYRNAHRIECLIDAMKVDLIHARSRAPAWSAYIAARRRKVPFVTTYHGIYNGKSPLKRFYNSVMARGDAVIANSQFTAEHLIREHQIDPVKVTAILRGVDLQKFDPARVSDERVAAVRKSWGLSPEDQRPILLHAARLTRWKGQLLAIEAADKLNKAGGPPFALVFVGDAQGRDAFVEEMKTQIADRGLQDSVVIAGHCDDMPAAFKAASLVLQPSIEPEAFGRSAAEAQAMGAPVIAAAHGGLVEVVQDGSTGALVRPGDADALMGALSRMLAMPPEQRKAMGPAGILRARRLFAKESLQEATLNVYAKLIGAKHTGAISTGDKA